MAFNYRLFIVKNNFAPAGVNGIATMIQYKTGFSIACMSILINVPLCILAYFFVDKDFAKKTLCYCLVYSGVYLVLQRLGLSVFQYDAGGHDTIFPVIISGILGGVVYGCGIRLGACTGGTYSNDQKQVIICVVNKHQLADFQKILSKYDDTFSFSEMVNETYGNFKHIR